MQDATPDDMQDGEIYSGGFVYTPKADYADGLQVGDDIDLSQTYYVNVGTESAPDFREVTITKDTYYTQELNDGAAHNDRVQKVQRSDGNRVGYFGDASPVSGWTPITGEGMYYMKDAESAAVHNNFVLVQSENGTLTHDAYSNKLIAAKSGNTTDGMIVGPGESIGGWNSGDSDVIVVDTNGVEHTVKYANKGSTFHYNMFIYYVDGNGDIVYLTQGANESDGDSKYNYEREGVGKYYYTYNNTLGSYGGKGYYTGTYYRANEHQGKVALFINDGGTTRYLGLNGVDNRTDAIHDHQVVYTGPLYRLQTLQRATYFTYSGAAVTGQPQDVTSRLSGDVLTGLPLYTRRVSGEAEIVDNDPDDVAGGGDFGVLVDTTNNFKGNLFIQKKLYRDDSTGTYNIKLESWATGNMSQTEGGGPMDVILVVDLSHSMEEDGSNFLINGQHRIVYVREAIEDFINTMYDANQSGADIRLAITSFSNKNESVGSDVKKYPLGVYNGSTFTQMKNCSTSTYQNALKKVDDTGKTQLLASLQTDPFQDPQGNGTYPEPGMQLAINILQNRAAADQSRDAVVVFFTDGWTGTDTQSASKYAEAALTQTNTLKSTYNATIYSIGVFHFDDADPNQMYYQYDTDDPNITVKNYMEHMSSMYNSTQMEVITTKLNGQPRTDGAHRITNNTPDNTDQTYYYRIRTGTGSTNPLQELNDAFSAIAETIAETDVPVDTDSILRDVINQNDFALPANGTGTVTAKVVPAKNINSLKQIEWDYANETSAPSTVRIIPATESGNQLKSVDVTGYDYQANFSAPATAFAEAKKGSKLVVRIKGLMPKHGGEVYSNSDAGIINDEGMYLPVESPFDFIDSRSYVVDFNADMKFAENGLLVSGADKYVTQIQTNSKTVPGQNNGAFSKDSGNTVSYQLMKRAIANGEQPAYEDYSFTGTDTALVFGKYYSAARATADKTAPLAEITTKQMVNGEKVDQTVSKAWQVVNMVPASSIYYDDDLAGESVVIGDGSGFNVDLNADAGDAMGGTDFVQYTFTFTGTGIDVYCTTNPGGGYIQAKVDNDNSTVKTIRNYEKNATRYNVPTIFYRGLDYGQHVITLNILPNAGYQFDGVRVYGTNDDQSIYSGDAANEKNASYTNLRGLLVNDNAEKFITYPGNTDAEGILYVDDATKVTMTQPMTDAEGNVIIDDETGEQKTQRVYATDYLGYKANSPKNEIYLEQNQGIAFTVTGYSGLDADAKIYVGLSTGQNEKAYVKYTNAANVSETDLTEIQSGLDMYYPLTPANVQGDVATFVIVNTSSAVVSVTNLKISGNSKPVNVVAGGGAIVLSADEAQEPEAVTLELVVNETTLKVLANLEVEGTASEETGTTDPTPTPGIAELIHQLISTFVSNLFRSIARLFGN